MDKVKSYAAPMLVVGCVLFGLLLLSLLVVVLVIDYFGLDKPINHWLWEGQY